MAKESKIETNKRRRRLVEQYAEKRKALKAIINDRSKRCEITGRPRAFYRKMKICRNQLRELASQGMIPGMVKSSW